MKLNKQKIKVTCQKCMQPIPDTLNDIYYAEGLQSWVIPICQHCIEELEYDIETRIDSATSAGHFAGYDDCEDEYKTKLDKKDTEINDRQINIDALEEKIEKLQDQKEKLKNALLKKNKKQS